MKLLLIISLFPFIGFSQVELTSDLASEIEKRVINDINKGIAIATIDSLGNVKYFNAGYEDKYKSKITENSIFEIASVSKTFTATLLKRLNLNNQQEIRSFIPDSLPEKIKQIKFEELINHTSGLPRLPPDYWTSNWDDPFSDHDEEKLMESLMVSQLDSNNNWNYSNLGYALLGYILDELTNDNGLEDMISSLNLESTHCNSEIKPTVAPHNFGKEVSCWSFPVFNRYMGGIRSSTSDLAKYLRYQIENSEDFSSSSFNENILINQEDSLVSKNGWLVFFKGEEQLIWHNGISGGCNSFIGYNVSTKSAIVILSNSQSSITDIGLHYLSKSFPLNSPKIPLISKIEEKIDLNQLDSIQITWNKFDSLHFDKNPINLYWLQCHYISNDSLEIALMLNELLLSDFENDWEVFYYRARIFESMDDYKSAVEMYEKVSELFPENTFSEERIKLCLTKPKLH